MRRWLRDAMIGRKIRSAMRQIVDHERLAGATPAAIVDIETELQGAFRIRVERPTDVRR